MVTPRSHWRRVERRVFPRMSSAAVFGVSVTWRGPRSRYAAPPPLTSRRLAPVSEPDGKNRNVNKRSPTVKHLLFLVVASNIVSGLKSLARGLTDVGLACHPESKKMRSRQRSPPFLPRCALFFSSDPRKRESRCSSPARPDTLPG